MKLIFDIGNTAAKIAVFDGWQLVEVFWDSNRSFTLIDAICQKYTIERGIVSTVVKLSDVMKRQLEKLSIPLIYLTPRTPLPVSTLVDLPDTLGGDRLAAVVEAISLKPDRELLIIDAGTAITYEFITASGQYIGGNISPGVNMRFRALHEYTSLLPLVDKEGPLPEAGIDTDTAIRVGVMKGVEYEIKGCINTLIDKYPQLLVFLTGGEEFSFDTNLKSIIFADRFLVLKGLNRILEYNNDEL